MTKLSEFSKYVAKQSGVDGTSAPGINQEINPVVGVNPTPDLDPHKKLKACVKKQEGGDSGGVDSSTGPMTSEGSGIFNRTFGGGSKKIGRAKKLLADLINISKGCIEIGNNSFNIEYALTFEQQQLGLSYREGISANHGMFFIFSDSSLYINQIPSFKPTGNTHASSNFIGVLTKNKFDSGFKLS